MIHRPGLDSPEAEEGDDEKDDKESGEDDSLFKARSQIELSQR